MTLRRGFKTEAETRAKSVRDQLGLPAHAALDLTQVAALYSVRIANGADLVDRGRYEEIERIQAFAFSAVTFEMSDGSKVVVTHPLRRKEREASDIAHELAHVILNHDLSRIEMVAGVPFRTCLPDQEEEATALGGTLLLPRPLLLRAARSGWDVDEIARRYGVTVEMARFRMNTTGVARQVAAR
jgi:hypothetical protein